MKPLFKMTLLAAVTLLSLNATAQEYTDYSNESCKVVEQNGSIEPWACRNSEAGRVRCYADVETNGAKFRAWGGCAASFSDCWSTGDSKVEPCNH